MFLINKVNNLIRDEKYSWERTEKLDQLFMELDEMNHTARQFGVYA